MTITKAAIITGLSLAALFGAYSQGHSVASTAAALEAERLTSELAGANAAASEAARKLERASAVSMTTIDNAYQQGRADAQTKTNAVVAGLGNGSIRVRDSLTCPTTTNVSATSTSTSQRDAGEKRGLQPADAAIAIGIAAEADDVARQLRAAQDVIRSMEATCRQTTSGR